MDKKSEAYFKTDEAVEAQLAVEKDMVGYHKNMLSFLGLDVESIQNKRYLDVGCARGGLMEYFMSKGFDPYGCDISRWAVKECKKRFGPEHIVLADASTKKPFDKKFGLITCFGVLGLVEKQESLMKNCFGMLDKGGIFIASAPNNDRPGVIRKITKREHSYNRAKKKYEWLGMLKSAGFEDTCAEIIQRIPFSRKLTGKNSFMKTRFGDPVILIGKAP